MNVADIHGTTHKKRAWVLLKVLWKASPWADMPGRNGEAQLLFRAFAEALEDVASVRDGCKRPASDVVEALVLLSAPRIKMLDMIGIETDYFWRLANEIGVFA